MLRITEPRTENDYKQYFHLRWKILRAPWNQAEGSEIDDIEHLCFHLMIVDDSTEKVTAVARLQFNTDTEAQIRYMAVEKNHERKGLGRKLVTAMEKHASDNGFQSIVLDAREPAVGFYEKLGYTDEGKSYLLFDVIQHYRMLKQLNQ